jgi:hypothetical protein
MIYTVADVVEIVQHGDTPPFRGQQRVFVFYEAKTKILDQFLNGALVLPANYNKCTMKDLTFSGAS